MGRSIDDDSPSNRIFIIDTPSFFNLKNLILLNFKKISTDYKSNFKGCSIDLQKTEVSRDCQEGSEPTEQAGMQVPRKDSGRSQ